MDWKVYQQYLIQNLPLAVPASGGKFVHCRCMECGDSIHPHSKHMYIYIPWENDGVSWYYCHKCNCSGFMSHRKLIEWGIYDKELAQELNEYNASVFRNPSYLNKYSPNRSFKVFYENENHEKETQYKLRYIQERVGVPLTLEQLSSLKIVLRLSDLLKQNHVYKLTRHENIVRELSEYFIGFLSIDNAFLNMRRVVKEGVVYQGIDKRYVNYQIFDKENTSQRFYTIPTTIDLNVPQRIKLHISEGPFDILSVYLNVTNQEPGIYTCVAGSNYISVILYFLIEKRLPMIELHIYPDNDKQGSILKMKELRDKIPDPTIPIYIHRNLMYGEKDFGVPKNRIRIGTERIQ